MKKILTLALICLISTVTFAQTDSTSCCKKKSPITGYLSYGLSVTNSSDFNSSSYTGLEGGIMKENFGLDLVFGRGSLKGLGSSTDNIQNYFYEVKTFASYPIGNVSGSFILGYGGYIDTPHMFIEYGAGLCYNIGKVGLGATYSNWDGVNYITPSITLNF